MNNIEFESANELFKNERYSEARDIYSKLLDNEIVADIAALNYVLCNLKMGNFPQAYKETISFLSKADNHYLSILYNNKNIYQFDQEFQYTLSVIVPVHNSGKYLEKCLNSILEQSFTDFELIVINDGSTDNSAEIIESYSKKDARVKVINNEIATGSPGTPRNQALEICQGKFVGFVDSDDWIEPDFYDLLISKAMNENSDIVFSGGFYNIMENGDKQLRKYKEFDFLNRNSSQYRFHDSFMIWDKIFDSTFLKVLNIKLGDTKAAVDVPFIFKAYYYAQKVSFLPDLIGYNYRRDSSSSVTVAHRKNSSCEFEFTAFSDVISWANMENVGNHYKLIIDVKMVSSLMYTIKIISDEFLNSFFYKVKSAFESVNEVSFKEFCIQNKKWWLYKEFLTIRDGSLAEATSFIQQKKQEAIEKEFEKKTAVKVLFEGDQSGIMFFPCWTSNNPYQRLFYQYLSTSQNINVAGFAKEAFVKEHLLRSRNKYTYIHLHWLHVFMDFSTPTGSQEFIDTVKYAKELGYKIIYTAHNIISHDSQFVENELKARIEFSNLVDIAIAHGEAAKRTLINQIGMDESKIQVMPHGTYGDYYGKRVPLPSARKRLSIPIDSYVFLFFGNIKGYKGVDELLHSFENISQEFPNAHLLIAGRVLDLDSSNEIYSKLSNSNITFHEGFIADEEVKYYFSASNVCVLPYRKVLTSGAAMLSISFSTPVIAPDIGVLPEFVDENIGTLFSDYDEMEKIMRMYVAQGLVGNIFNQDDFNDVNKKLSWENVIKELKL
ncbi:MAG: glycosyltransferase [Alteromonadaceae bacterium TMED7]|nr:glycosyl transferase family 2 [Alteromonadaceae bacterium]RPH20982.1 MAG: glycosyltransferase [Alteromonadaceae bacterium TMED7]|tara:strand:+ start:2961 stop:5291 length:2331 start_codon:yes stop_codon:yes gene_type:complete